MQRGPRPSRTGLSCRECSTSSTWWPTSTRCARLACRGGDLDLEPVAKLARERSELILEVEGLRQKQNAANETMRKLAKEPEKLAVARTELRQTSERIKAIDFQLREVEEKLEDQLLRIPNLPHESVPDGLTAEQNVVVRSWGEKPRFDFQPKEHADLGEALGILDFERAAKIAGARFVVYLVWGPDRAGAGPVHARHPHPARLPRGAAALHGQPRQLRRHRPVPQVRAGRFRGEGPRPVLGVDRRGAGHEPLPRRGPRWRDVAHSPLRLHALLSFRGGQLREGHARPDPSAPVPEGRARKFTRPESSYEEHEQLVRDAEEILQRLGLHYRVMLLCAGDMGFAAAKCYDLEVWLPGQNASPRDIVVLELRGLHQARRAKIRFKDEGRQAPAGAS